MELVFNNSPNNNMTENNNKNNKSDFSKEKGNLEIVTTDNGKKSGEVSGGGDAVSISPEGIDVKRGGNIVIGSLNIMAEPFKKRAKNHYQGKGSRLHLIVDGILAIIIIVLLASFFLIKNWQPKFDVILEIRAIDEIITSGEVESFEIDYKNNNDEKMDDVIVTLKLPENFVLTDASPKGIFNTNTNSFKVGDLSPNEMGTAKISGMVLGEIGERQVIALSMDYSYKGRKMKNLNSLVYEVEESILDLDLDFPNEVYKGTNFSGKLILKNNGDKDIEEEIEISFSNSDLVIKNIDYTEGSLYGNTIIIKGISAKKILEISFEAETETNERLLPVVAELYLNTERGKMKQIEKSKNLAVVESKFKASLNTDKRVLKERDIAVFKLNYENGEDKNLHSLKFEIKPDSSAFAVDKVSLIGESKKYEISGNTIRLLEVLEKGKGGSLEFEASFKKKRIGTELSTSLSAQINYKIGDKKVNYSIISSKIKFFSDLQISSKGRYYSEQGDQLGVGPLPPAISVPTSYWIFWEVDNLGNNLKDLSISADLGENVAWSGEKSLLAGKIRYGAIGSRVIWNVDEISKEGGKYRAGFEVKLIPTKTQKNKIVDLVKDIKYSAYDAFAEREITGELKNITTDLKDDPIAKGKGKVIEMDIIE